MGVNVAPKIDQRKMSETVERNFRIEEIFLIDRILLIIIIFIFCPWNPYPVSIFVGRYRKPSP